MSASRPDGWTTAEGPSVRARARLSVRKADAGAAFAVFVSQWRGATMNANDPTATSCCVCWSKEIPLDAAFTPEGAEYVEHFCGLECYQRFQARASTATETSGEPNACGSPPSN
uniref:Urf2 protein n=1 Tax=Pseudomonas sp. ED23-33 TaxID=83781 RepID=Q9F3W3_9PROT|nr:Urf2 protein [Pseudomonas sp. ED23-33]